MKQAARDEVVVLHILINLLNSCFLEAAQGDPVIHAVADQGLFRVTTNNASEAPGGGDSAAQLTDGRGILHSAKVDGTVRPFSTTDPVLNIIEVKRDNNDAATHRKQHTAALVAYMAQRQRESHNDIR